MHDFKQFLYVTAALVVLLHVGFGIPAGHPVFVFPLLVSSTYWVWQAMKHVYRTTKPLPPF